MGATADLVREVMEAWNRRDLATVGAALTADFEWVEHEQYLVDVAGGRTGNEAVEHVTADLDDGWEGYTAEVREVVEVGGDRAVVVLRETARGAASGAEMTTDFGYLVTLRDGKVARVEVYRDPADAFAAAG